MADTIVVTMPDGDWEVPVSVVAEDRARYYAKNDPDFGGSYERSLAEDTLPLFATDDFEILDWAANNMNWSDVKDRARHLGVPIVTNKERQEAWVNGKKRVVREEEKHDGEA